MDFDSLTLLAHAHTHHDHAEVGLFQEAWGLITDPAHAITEVFYNVMFDLLLIPIVFFLYKKIRPKLKRDIHNQIDREHGIDHSEDVLTNLHHCHGCGHMPPGCYTPEELGMKPSGETEKSG